MTAYIIATVTVLDPEAYRPYTVDVPAVIAQYGGRYLVRGGAVSAIEGDMALDRVVVIEFPSVEAARAFHASPEYAPLLVLRQSASHAQLVIVEGVAP